MYNDYEWHVHTMATPEGEYGLFAGWSNLSDGMARGVPICGGRERSVVPSVDFAADDDRVCEMCRPVAELWDLRTESEERTDGRIPLRFGPPPRRPL